VRPPTIPNAKTFSSGTGLLRIGALLIAQGCAHQTYRRAEVDASGQLRIVTSRGREIRPHKSGDQVGVDQVAMSADRRTVGWLTLHPNCCTTYPIPLELHLLWEGGERTVTGDGRPIWRWSFTADGRQVALRQGPVHGPAPAHFELRDVRTGRLVSSFDAASGDAPDAPAWARALVAPR
jgi:hypothetical protein